jgi:tetratricopeptide (TPR) repeat protein
MRQGLHRTIVVVDVAGFGDRSRTNEHQVAVRTGLYAALRRAIEDVNVPWHDCDHEDRGDGVFVLAPPTVPKVVFAEKLPHRLANAIREHNADRRPEEQIRLRMALHAGEVQYDEHGVAGSSVNLAFRLLEATQLKVALAESDGALAVIVSSWFFDEVVRHSAASKPETYRSIHVNVKETSATAWICLPDQAYVPPPFVQPRPGPPNGGPRRNELRQTLPRDVTAFVGRKDELELLLNATATPDVRRPVAVYAIDGMAGIGKTALAVHVAHMLADRFPDGQLYVRLHAHTPGQRPADPIDLLTTLLSAAGVVPQRMTTDVDILAGMWRDYLVGKKVLLILDDAAGHHQVEPLLPSSPGCLVVVTSRRRLSALDATVTLSLYVLTSEEAVALFARLSERTITPADTAHVAEIVRLAGYLPLAIALVAVRLRHHHAWSIADLAADLSSTRGRLLEIRSEDIEVAAAFDLSYRDLSTAEQRFFCHLGIHPGPELDMYGAAALADVPLLEAREHLDALYNDHLLDESAPGRYRMPDLVRDYVRRRIRQDLPDDRGESVTRLLAYYQRTARFVEAHFYGTTSVGDDSTWPVGTIADFSSALAWMRAERDNLIACVEYAASRGLRQEVVDLEDALISFLWVAGPWEQAKLLRQSQQPRDDPLSRAHALHRLGQQRWAGNDFPGSIDAYTQALAIYQELDLPTLRKRVANTLSLLGIARLATGDLPGAIDAQQQAREIFRNLDYPLGEAYVLNELGVAYRVAGEFDAAAQAHTTALSIFSDFGGEFGGAFAFALVGLGSVRRATGEIRESVRMQQRAAEIYRALDNSVGEADALDELGAAVGATGDLVGAENLHKQALGMYRRLEHRLGQAEVLNNMGRLSLKSGNPRRALEEHRAAHMLASEVHGLLEEARALEGTANCEFVLGQPEDAVSHLRAAASIYEEIGAAEASGVAQLRAEVTNRGDQSPSE